MANTRFTGISESYIFDEAGGMRDQLEQTILNELQSKKYPLKATISTIITIVCSIIICVSADNWLNFIIICNAIS